MVTPPTHPAISVVIPCLGHSEELAHCLSCLQHQSLVAAYEIIVVDSQADPEVADTVAAFPEVRLVSSKERLFPGAARNLGVRNANAEFIVFTDADCLPEPEFLDAALSALQSGTRVVGGPVLDARPFHPIAVADNLLQFVDFSASRPSGPALYFPGCNLAVHRKDFVQLGGFRPDLPCCEDTLFCEAAADFDASGMSSRGADNDMGHQPWADGLRFESAMRVRHSGRCSFASMWAHQESFGYQRGLLGLQLPLFFQKLGRSRTMTVAVMIKRLTYIIRRTAEWHPPGLLRILILFPLLVCGLLAWARGFRCGCVANSRSAQ